VMKAQLDGGNRVTLATGQDTPNWHRDRQRLCLLGQFWRFGNSHEGAVGRSVSGFLQPPRQGNRPPVFAVAIDSTSFTSRPTPPPLRP